MALHKVFIHYKCVKISITARVEDLNPTIHGLLVMFSPLLMPMLMFEFPPGTSVLPLPA